MPEGSPRFSATSWTVVLNAANTQSPECSAAMARICSEYWHPLYFFVRRKGNNPEQAADLIQGFFLKVIENGFLKSADQTKGRFRTFMLTALKRYMINEWQAAQAQKRGKGATHFSLDFKHAENLYADEEGSTPPSDRSFDRSWALELLAKSIELLEKDYVSRDKAELFKHIKGFLPGTTTTRPQEAVAADLGIPVNTLRSHIRRARERFRKTLRQCVEDTIDSGSDVDDEIRYLISVLKP